MFAAAKRGHVLVSQDRAQAAYVRTVNYGPGREQCLRALRELEQQDIPSIPPVSAEWLYDDKIAQAGLLHPWMPETKILMSEPDLSGLEYPFVSKSAHGSASHCVRLIETPEQARAEVAAVFGAGLEVHGGVQKDYLIWQRFIPGNSGDVRVVVCGERMFGLTRGNRDDVPFASGSGRNTPILEMDNRIGTAFLKARLIADELKLPWSCYDFVFEGAIPYCLEVSFSWVEEVYNDCQCFDRDLNPTGETAASIADFAVDEMEKLAA